MELDCEVHCRETGNACRKLVFSVDGERLMGIVLVGDITNAGLFRHVIKEGMTVPAFKKQMISHRMHWGHLATG